MRIASFLPNVVFTTIFTTIYNHFHNHFIFVYRGARRRTHKTHVRPLN